MTRNYWFFLCIGLFFLAPATAQTWESCFKNPAGKMLIDDIAFADKYTGVAIGQQSFRTTDAGKTWTRILNSYSAFSRIQFVSSTVGYAVGSNNLVLKTTDAGATWTEKKTNYPAQDFMTLYCLNENEVFLLGPEDADNFKFANYVYYTANGGETWTRMSTGSTNTMRAMHMWNADSGAIIGLNQNVLITSNRWQGYDVKWVSGYQPVDMAVISDSIILLACNNGKIARSSDYGKTFSNVVSGTSNHLFAISFVNDSVGFISGQNATFLRTTNYGKTWSAMPFPANAGPGRVFGLNPFYVYAAVLQHPPDSTAIYKYGSESYGTTNINYISGYLSGDFNGNCLKESSEYGHSNVVVSAEPGPWFTVTEDKGYYKIMIPDTGHYQVSAWVNRKQGGEENLCSDSKIKNVYLKQFESDIKNINFVYNADSAVELLVDISASRKRRCARNSNVITIENTGWKHIDSVLVEISLSPYLEFVSADVPVLQKDGKLYIHLRNLALGEKRIINLTDSVKCGDPSVMGKLACIRVLATPVVYVLNRQTWDSSYIVVKTGCYKDSLVIIDIKNDGYKNMSDSVEIILYTDSLQNITTKIRLEKGDSIKLAVKSFGKTIITDIPSEKHHPYYKMIRVFQEGCGKDSITGKVSKNIPSKIGPVVLPPFEDEICLPIRDSYDPNEVTVLPEGTGPEHFTGKYQLLEYTVHFQNTGTDTAYQIVVQDSFSKELNLKSFEFLAASHNCKMEIKPDSLYHVLHFTFKNIMLPDSHANEQKSHGFVSYRILPQQGLADKTKVHNRADIYFDFNPPVRTNTTLNTLFDTTYTGKKPELIRCDAENRILAGDTLCCTAVPLTFYISGNTPKTLRWWVADAGISISQDLADRVVLSTTSGVNYLKLLTQNCDAVQEHKIRITGLDKPAISLGADRALCPPLDEWLKAGDSTALYEWNIGEKKAAIHITTAGTYSVTGSNFCGTDRDTVAISVKPVPGAFLGPDVVMYPPFRLVLKKPADALEITWPDGSHADSVSINEYGVFVVSLRHECGTFKDTLEIVDPYFRYRNNGFTVFPNPVSRELTVMNTTGKEAEYRLYNAAGQVVLKSGTSSVVHTLFTENLKPGFYVLKIRSAEQESTFRLIRAGN